MQINHRISRCPDAGKRLFAISRVVEAATQCRAADQVDSREQAERMRRRVRQRLADEGTDRIARDRRIEERIVHRDVPAWQRRTREIDLKTAVADLSRREQCVGVRA